MLRAFAEFCQRRGDAAYRHAAEASERAHTALLRVKAVDAPCNPYEVAAAEDRAICARFQLAKAGLLWVGLRDWAEERAWWISIRHRRAELRRALSGVQEARTCLERRENAQGIGAAAGLDREQLAIEAWDELKESEVRLRELLDYHE